jgi:DNA primase
VQIPRLHPDTIEEVQQRVDIVDVISEYVVLRKRGKDYLGLCPFHDEKSPSFSVSQDKQVYYCFGCSQGGNSFKFLMEIGKQSFAEVVLDLARRYQIPVKTIEPEQKQELQRQFTLREQLYEILAVTASFYQHALYSPQGAIALNYLKQERKLQPSTIEQFQLGYAPAGWETLYRYLVEQKRYPVNLVLEAGLIKKRSKGDGYYDVFRDRLMIPICDNQNRVIAFGSRILNPEEQPKYLNSPETPLFNKSKTLFALSLARTSISKEDRAVVVEGYFDAIALHEAGIENVVASLGTAFTSDQLKQLLRYTPSKQVILNFDADNAGIKATERAIKEIEDLIYSGVVKLRVLNLPDGKDADEFLKSRESVQPNGREIYYSLLDKAPLWLDWQISQLISSKNLKAADDLQTVATSIVALLDRLQDANQRNYYLTYCAELLSQGDTRLIRGNLESLKSQLKSLNKRIHQPLRNEKEINRHQRKPTNLNIPTNPETELLEGAESLLLQIYIHCPRYRNEIVDRLEEKDLLFNLDHHRFLWQQIIELETKLANSASTHENTLLTGLHNLILDFSKDMASVTKVVYLDEKTQEDIFNADISIEKTISSIEEAISSMELVNCIQKRIYCIKRLPTLKDNKSQADCVKEIQNLYQKIRELEKSGQLENG